MNPLEAILYFCLRAITGHIDPSVWSVEAIRGVPASIPEPESEGVDPAKDTL